MKRLVFDLDNTISFCDKGDYASAKADLDFVNRMQEYKKAGFEIVIMTSRNVKTFSGNLGMINKHTLPLVIKWLEEKGIPYDEVYMGKPWCGEEGFYVDDRAIRPSEFKSLTYSEIVELIK